MHGESAPIHGTVYLVGAGPGDPGLLTLRGAECLRRADLVLYDYLVNPRVLRFAPPSATRTRLGHHGGKQSWDQAEINARMIAAARQGKTVVRLKGGDPVVFGRSADEIDALTAAGIPYEIVPGITAALAAGAYAAIPITHGDHSSAVALATGHERDSKHGPPLDYAALADFPGTLVFYMGIHSAPQWSQSLLGRGKPPETPVAIVRRCTWNDQETIRCTLSDVAAVVAEQQIKPPAVVIVGKVAGLAPVTSWFAARPLFGLGVLVTRPVHQADALAELLHENGAEVYYQPAIEISDPVDWAPVDRALEDLGRYDWMVFSSSNGVHSFLDRLGKGHGDLRRLGSIRIAAIGPGTAEELGRYHLRADLVPHEYRAEALAGALSGEASGRKFLLIRASRGREVLAEQLTAAGGEVEQVVAYRSTDVEQIEPEVADAIAAGRVDWIAVTSSAIAQSLAKLLGDVMRQVKLASISPVTSETLRRLGYEPAAEAKEYTMAGLVEALVAAVTSVRATWPSSNSRGSRRRR